MNTTTNTQGVSEAMVDEGCAAFSRLQGRQTSTCIHGGTHTMTELRKAMRAALEAALSAPEPAAQGEEGFDARKYVRHMADVLEAGGDLFKVDADLSRLAAAINKAANTAPPAQPAAQGEADGWPVLAEELSKTFSAEIYDLFADADEITQSSVVNALERAIKKHCKFPVADFDDYDLEGVLLTIEQRQKVVKEAMAFIDGKPAAWRCRYFDKETGVGFWRYSVGEPQRSHQTGNMGFEKEALYTAPPAQPERVPEGEQ